MSDSNYLLEQQWQSFVDEYGSAHMNDVAKLIELANQYDDDLPLAIFILEKARALRPGGPLILQRLQQYNEQWAEQQDRERRDAAPPIKRMWHVLMGSHFAGFVLLPWLLFVLYLVVIASDRYESQAQVIVKQPDAMSTMTPELSFLSGIGVGAGDADAALVKAYIGSLDMLQYVDSKLNLRQHYAEPSLDIVGHLLPWDRQEDFLDYYRQHVRVAIDPESGIINLAAQAFTPSVAKALADTLLERSEWFVNQISHDMARAQLAFIDQEIAQSKQKLDVAKQTLQNFQAQYELLDPEAQGAAYMQITYGLESEIAKKKAEIIALQEVMTADAPQVINAINELKALQQQSEQERARLSATEQSEQSMGAILAQYANLKLDYEIAQQAYSSALISAEKSRIEAIRQAKFLVTIQQASEPEDSAYPKVIYNSILAAVVLSLLFGIGRLLLAVYREFS